MNDCQCPERLRELIDENKRVMFNKQKEEYYYKISKLYSCKKCGKKFIKKLTAEYDGKESY